MTTKFITNQEKLLADVINNILPSSKNLYFLVGYFYFSGFQEIYENLKDKHLKILVGLELQTDFANKIIEFEVIQQTITSRNAIKDSFNQSLVKLFSETDFFDSNEKQDAFRLFLEKLKNGTLEIRKTLKPNHAKLYIFENAPQHSQKGEFPGSVITGSSNLTRSGFRDRFEINVISRDATVYNEAYEIFQQLWNESVVIADKFNLDDFMNTVVENVWFEKMPKPFIVYLRVLEEYFSLKGFSSIRPPGEITRGKYIDLKYQIDAIQKAIEILKRHNGVIVADVVGLGKSIIASVIAHNLGYKTIIITPPHLRPQWVDYSYEFDFTSKIYTSGMIDTALKELDSEPQLIIIDEAHKYRNELTEDYANLHQICQKNKVVLLSATPFNNRPQDIFSMVKLFQLTSRSTMQNVENLSFQFKQLIKEYKDISIAQKKQTQSSDVIAQRIKKVGDEIRNLLYPVVIRRSRLDLEAIVEYREDLKRQKITFPKVNEPKLLEYNLDELSEIYEKTIKLIAPDDEHNGGFIGARYKPTSYIKDIEKYKREIAKDMGIDENLLKQTQVNLAIFMKRLLVRRFESSIFAFQSTLDNMIRSSETIEKWYEKFGKVPIYKRGKLPDVDSLEAATGEDIEEELKAKLLEKELQSFIEKGLWLIDKKELRKGFIEDVKSDIKLLKDIQADWFSNGFPKDPKLLHLTQILQDKIKKEPKRKIIVFSEFADTANYLYDNIKDKLRVFKYTSADSSKANKKTIKTNFDASSQSQENKFDILIATDAISEGFNLHRAGAIFNYDIPYNPTRVIQRVGRINRINKKVFDELFIFNFFPTATGERETRIKQISTLKIAMVHALFGEDTKVLTKDEQLQSFFAEQFRQQWIAQEETSPEVRFENFIRQIRSSHPQLLDEALKIPKRCQIQRTVSTDKKGVLVFGKKGGEYAFKFAENNNDSESVSLSPTQALAMFEAQIGEDSKQVSKDFEPIYERLKEKLFSKRTAVAIDKGKRELIDKIEALIKKLPTKKDYFEDLLYVVRQLDSLPERYARQIRTIDFDNLSADIEQLLIAVPHKYLGDIIERERQIEQGQETIIVSEEFVK